MEKRGKKKVSKRMVIACSGGRHLVKSVAEKIGARYCILETEIFPDTELRIRLPREVKNLDVYFLQSFYKNENDVNDKLLEVLFAAKTAKELGAKNIYLIAPYLSYLREDIRFRKGEAISARIFADLLGIFKEVYVVEPHLHRFEKLSQFFPNAKKVILTDELALYIKKNIGKCLLVGPDMESVKWVSPIAKKLNLEYLILKKHRFSSRKVKVVGRKKLSAEKVVMIDDIISTGYTLIEASKSIKTKKLYFISAHGLFPEKALSKLRKRGKVIVSNTIPSSVSKIDCSSALAKVING